MNNFTLSFLFLLATSLVVHWWLATRHLRHVRAHRDEVPAAFRAAIPLSAHQKAADYTVARTRVSRWEYLAETALLLIWTLGGGIEFMDRAWRGLESGPVATGVGVILSVLLISALIDLPFAAYRTFRVESRFGFNRTTARLFLTDRLKESALLLGLGGPLLAVILWLMLQAGSLWWIWVWAVWIGFGLLMTRIFPTYIAPLFNRFEPLGAGELRTRIEHLLARNGFASDGVFVMDGSRRSGHGNAYFTGLGRNKRIVFFDTLVERLPADELEAVLAHEIGHFKRRHVAKRLAMMAALSLAALALLGWLVAQPWFYQGLGVNTPSMHAALLLFVLAAPVFTFFLQPAGAWMSRKHEFEADDFAAAQSRPQTLIRALVRLYADNASTLTPDPLYSAFHDSHPPAPVRVAHLDRGLAPATG